MIEGLIGYIKMAEGMTIVDGLIAPVPSSIHLIQFTIAENKIKEKG